MDSLFFLRRAVCVGNGKAKTSKRIKNYVVFIYIVWHAHSYAQAHKQL